MACRSMQAKDDGLVGDKQNERYCFSSERLWEESDVYDEDGKDAP